jgi:hypothetical protein
VREGGSEGGSEGVREGKGVMSLLLVNNTEMLLNVRGAKPFRAEIVRF